MRISVDQIEKAFQLLVADPMLSVKQNGPQSLYVKMPNERIPQVNALLVESGIRVRELSPIRPRLEEVFLTLT